jgi:hypothetical protein
VSEGQVCYHCGQSGGCRPYGPGASPVCIDCVTNFPEVDRIASANYLAQGEASVAMSAYNAVVVGPNGPVPLTEELLFELKRLVEEEGAEVEIIVDNSP